MAETGRRVLVPVDLSVESEAAVVLASELADPARDRILILHVIHERGDGAGFYHAQDDSGELTPIPRIAENLLARFVDDMRRRYPSLKPLDHACTFAVSGLPTATIREVAEREGASLIVMADTQKNRLARFFYGSVAEQVARTSPCPVVRVQDRALG